MAQPSSINVGDKVRLADGHKHLVTAIHYRPTGGAFITLGGPVA